MSRLPTPGGDEGNWGNLLNDFLSQSLAGDGTLKPAAVVAAGAEQTNHKGQPNGYAALDGNGLVQQSELRLGISQQTATVYAACDLLASTSDISAFGGYTYDNGASGVGATITAGGNGQLVASGSGVSAGQRIAVNASNIYGGVPESGIYVVTNAGSASAAFVLTRAADANTTATLGAFFAVRASGQTVYFSPQSATFTVGTTGIDVAVESVVAHAEITATATGLYSHAEGTSTASGDYSHAEGSSATASGYDAHAEAYGTATDFGAHAEGGGHATAIFSHAEQDATASGDRAHAEGAGTASGHYSHAENLASAYATGMHAEAGAPFGSQFSRVTRARQTTDANPLSLVDHDFGIGLPFPDFNRSAVVTVRVLARRTDALGTVSAWRAQCLIDGDNTGSYRIVGSPAFTLIAQDSGATTWGVDDLAFDSGDPHSLNVTVHGMNAATINWTATIELDEVS